MGRKINKQQMGVIRFTAIVWNWTRSIFTVCLYVGFMYARSRLYMLSFLRIQTEAVFHGKCLISANGAPVTNCKNS